MNPAWDFGISGEVFKSSKNFLFCASNLTTGTLWEPPPKTSAVSEGWRDTLVASYVERVGGCHEPIQCIVLWKDPMDLENVVWTVKSYTCDVPMWKVRYEFENSTGLPEKVPELGALPLETLTEAALMEKPSGKTQDLVAPAAPQVQTQRINQKIESLFVSAKEEVFEDGMESRFSRGLVSMVREHGEFAVQMIADLILQEKANPEVASEALRWIGAIEHPATYHSRLSLLERSLNCLSPWVRDGATLGLAYMEDPHAISYLKRAIDREPYKLLRRNMRQVLAELEENDS